MVEFANKINLIPEYVPGKSIENISGKWGIKPEKIVKLASNENPLGPPEEVVNFLEKEVKNVNIYPDRIGISLLKKLSEYYSISVENLFIGNGSSEIVDMLCRIMLNPGDSGLTYEKEFALYKTCIKASDGELIEIPLEENFKRNVEAIPKNVNENTKVIFIANPNNPTGDFIEKDNLVETIEKIPENVLTVVDEAYIEYIGEENSLLNYFKESGRENLVILRTFSKIYGLAGLRVGYCFADKNIINALRKIKLPVNVPYLSQKGCEIALDCENFKEKSRRLVEEEKLRIFEIFKQNNIEYIEAKGNFYLVKDNNASKTVEKLESKGVVVRSLKPYSIDNYFRVTVGTERQNNIFLEEFLKTRGKN
ncbi:histidinol-phosphate aminotransferase [Thermotomaculum hydrothermale]|uniref:Histidinol-phosphate aminotransferase n=1 Tax=Thermotomaculum hydrothermale TaxID=981385 RepID=A0A7R6PIC0_9BACT|nr:histidinol-phosphate transaminase [Thermotomaculum hydrothermale]BBB33144.1 histidinol-phosphate aminotransferase [Thermotomaculum hydrothermale]